MIRINGISMALAYKDTDLRNSAIKKLRISQSDLSECRIAKRSIDARHGKVSFLFSLEVTLKCDEKKVVEKLNNSAIKLVEYDKYQFPYVKNDMFSPPVIVGSGPAGLFSALVLAESGVAPIVIERGKDIDSRNSDVKAFRITGKLNPESNIQFGEGGAGSFSDGKLNTGIQNSRCRFVLETFAKYGNAEDILWQARPHAGTDRLYNMVKGIRGRLLELGTKFLFETKMVDLVVDHNQIKGVVVESANGLNTIDCNDVILAIGHSARDTAEMLFNRGIYIEQKPFAVGVRIEHSRDMIDKAMYGSFANSPQLGAADYRLSVHPKGDRGVYTFCMCPGGEVVPAASEQNMVCVNGMSYYARHDDNSNSAVLVGVNSDDFPSAHPLAGYEFQRNLERKAFDIGGGDYVAPCQLVGDFLKGKETTKFGLIKPSYSRGVCPSNLEYVLSLNICDSLRKGISMMGCKIRGFDMNDAVLTGVESRTSSPIRIVRDESGQSNIGGIYPTGEGAGYAGGIVSSAVDGMKMAEMLIQNKYGIKKNS